MSRKNQQRNSREPSWLESARRAARKDERQMSLDLLFDESGTEQGDQAEGGEPKKQSRPEAASVAQTKRQKKRA